MLHLVRKLRFSAIATLILQYLSTKKQLVKESPEQRSKLTELPTCLVVMMSHDSSILWLIIFFLKNPVFKNIKCFFLKMIPSCEIVLRNQTTSSLCTWKNKACLESSWTKRWFWIMFLMMIHKSNRCQKAYRISTYVSVCRFMTIHKYYSHNLIYDIVYRYTIQYRRVYTNIQSITIYNLIV